MLKKKRKDYAFRRQFDERPNVILGCPGLENICAFVRLIAKPLRSLACKAS